MKSLAREKKSIEFEFSKHKIENLLLTRDQARKCDSNL